MSKDTKYEVCELDRVNVTAQVGGLRLGQLGVVLNPRLKRISILNVGQTDIYVNNGAADANSYLIMANAGNTFRATRNVAGQLQFFCATGDGDMNVQQEGDLI